MQVAIVHLCPAVALLRLRKMHLLGPGLQKVITHAVSSAQYLDHIGRRHNTAELSPITTF